MNLLAKISRKLVLYGTVIAVLSVILFPMYWLFSTSIKPYDQFFSSPPQIFPTSFSLEHFKFLLRETAFVQQFKNSLIVASVTTVFVISVTSIAAYGLTRFRFYGRKGVARFVLLIYMFPPILLIIPYYMIMVRIGLNNTLFGLVITYTAYSTPFSLWLLWEYFKTIPLDLEEAVLIDGGSRIQAFFYVVLPLAVPGIVATAIFAFTWAWVEYLYALVLIASESKKTLTLGISQLFIDVGVRWDLLMPAATLMTLPVMLLFALAQRQLVSGFAAGAVKG